MNILGTIAKTDDFEQYESEVYKPLIEKEILQGNHRWWALSKIYERTDNSYENITHMFFSLSYICKLYHLILSYSLIIIFLLALLPHKYTNNNNTNNH